MHDERMVTGEVVQIEREGSAMPAYFARPENANETTPTVAMAMHLWGVDREQRATADRFATEGFAAVVPDLLHASVRRTATKWTTTV